MAANWLDQELGEVERYEELLASCRLSANPVGRLVLALFQAATPQRERWSDDVCTGLQLVEHLQDVGEDARRGRVYLAAEDRRRWGCRTEDLLAPTASPGLRRVVADYARRARLLLGSAVPLVADLSGLARLAVAGFAAGGLAALDAIWAADGDVLGVSCRPARRDVVRHALALLLPPAPGPRQGRSAGSPVAGEGTELSGSLEPLAEALLIGGRR